MSEVRGRRLPPWFRRRHLPTDSRRRTESILRELRLNTVCDSARCPNRAECFHASTATIMILGDRCTRDCRFCAVGSGAAAEPDDGEPARVAEAVRRLGLRYVVVTSVARDDLPDFGARHFARTLEAVRSLPSAPVVELLTPDFAGDERAWGLVAEAKPDVWGHNVEVVPRLYPGLRPGADYGRSLRLLAWVKRRHPAVTTKSALMIGVGEERQEILAVCRDLKEAGVDLVVLGQYLTPSRDHWPVANFHTPGEFAALEAEIRDLGFGGVLAEPLARSSYRAEDLYRALTRPQPLP